MINPNQNTSEDVLRRLREASYERMRVELKCSIELLLKDFDMDWDDLRFLWAGHAKYKVIAGELTLEQLNEIAHIFSTEIYIIFRPRNPWVQT